MHIQFLEQPLVSIALVNIAKLRWGCGGDRLVGGCGGSAAWACCNY